MTYRVGIGYDIHRFAAGKKLILGGVQMPHPKGLSGHSDADILVHAICDALLGAMGDEDIGCHFPDTDKKYKNIPSLKLLKKVRAILTKRSFSVVNIDTMLLLEAPRVAPHKEKMKQEIADILQIKKDRIAIKATTHEGVGEIGRGEAAAAHAVVLIKKVNSQ